MTCDVHIYGQQWQYMPLPVEVIRHKCPWIGWYLVLMLFSCAGAAGAAACAAAGAAAAAAAAATPEDSENPETQIFF